MRGNSRVGLIIGFWVTLIMLVGAAPVSATTGDNVQKISAGEYHTCALRTGGTVWCWGDNRYGQLGDGTRGDANFNRLQPVQVKQGNGFLTDVKNIGAGSGHTCAVKNNGSVWCWGDATWGQVGDGTTGDVDNHNRLKAVQVKQGSGFLTGITQVSAGLYISCARRNDGTAWCWGFDGKGQLGDGTSGDSLHRRLKAVQVKHGSGFLTGVTQVSAGSLSQACARTSDGAAWCWGQDDWGQLGDGTTGGVQFSRHKAVRVVNANGPLAGVTGVAAGDGHGCATTTNGLVWCWGHASDGQTGDGAVTNMHLTAVKVKLASGGALTDVDQVGARGYFSCARRTGGTAWCWGSNEYGQIGDGTHGDANHDRRKAVQVIGPGGSGLLAGVASISAGRFHTCVAMADKSAWCWGHDGNGQLGDGFATPTDRTSPVQVVFP